MPCEVEVGDRVVFDGSVAREYVKNSDLVQVVESEIWAIVTDEGTAGLEQAWGTSVRSGAGEEPTS